MTRAPIRLAGLVLAALPIAAPPAPAGSEPREVIRSSRNHGIPMAWRMERRSDAGSGGRSCLLMSWGNDVIARLRKPGQADAAMWSVTVGIDNQPGSVRYLRINRKTFTAAEPDFRGSEAAEIVHLLKSPGEFAFEWAQSPDHAKRQGLYGTGDFAAMAAACERWVNQRQSAHLTPPWSGSRSAA